MEARKGGAMRLRLGVTCCSFLFLALLNSPIAADMGSPAHSCSKPKPYDPINIGSRSDLEMYNDSVNRYKRCIEQFVGEQNKAVNRHHEAAVAATEEYNSFVKAWKK
jgi:hypothetical protein